MLVELLAVGAAFCYASGGVASKFGTRTGNLILGFLISLATGIVAVAAVAVVTVEDWSLHTRPLVFFALAGLAGPGAGRILAIRAVRDGGTTVAVPVQASSNPLISSAAGVILFGETVGPTRMLGLGLIVTGIWGCARGGSANREASRFVRRGARAERMRHLVVLLPLSAGAAFAVADVLRKFALDEQGDPIVGALIGLLMAFVSWLMVLLVLSPVRAPVRITPSLGWFVLNGMLNAVALVSMLFALRIGDLSVVIPIVASQPVIVIVLGALVLRDLEKLRAGTIVGAAVVFAGVALLSVSS